MSKLIKKTGFLGNKKITYIEENNKGEYSFINGEWVWIQTEH